MDTTLTPRQITHDEKKAAEAAFAGRPFNPKWSDAARMYEIKSELDADGIYVIADLERFSAVY